MASRGSVLVTGGSGYISQFCIARLLNDGWKVRTTIRSLTRSPSLSTSMAGITQHTSALEICAADLLEDAGWTAAVKGTDFCSMLPPRSPPEPRMRIC